MTKFEFFSHRNDLSTSRILIFLSRAHRPSAATKCTRRQKVIHFPLSHINRVEVDWATLKRASFHLPISPTSFSTGVWAPKLAAIHRGLVSASRHPHSQGRTSRGTKKDLVHSSFFRLDRRRRQAFQSRSSGLRPMIMQDSQHRLHRMLTRLLQIPTQCRWLSQ